MEKLKQQPDMQKMLSDCIDTGSGGFDVHFDCENLSESDRELLEGKLKQVIKEAANRAQKNNGWGSVSADVKKQIMTALDDAVDWKKALSYFFACLIGFFMLAWAGMILAPLCLLIINKIFKWKIKS